MSEETANHSTRFLTRKRAAWAIIVISVAPLLVFWLRWLLHAMVH